MLLKDNKKGLVTLIMKKMSNKAHDMSPNFQSEYAEEAKTVAGAEQDIESGLNAAAEAMIQSMKSGDSKRLTSSLKNFISMILDQQEQNEED